MMSGLPNVERAGEKPARKLTQEEKLEELVKDSADQEVEIM